MIRETITFTDQSTADPIEKVRRYLTHMADKRGQNRYFFDDGYPREEIADDAKAAMAVFEQMAALVLVEPNEWKEAILEQLAAHAIDAPVDMHPRDVLAKIIDMAVVMAKDSAINAARKISFFGC